VGVAAVAAGGMIAAKASPEPLPPTTPAALVAQLQSNSVDGFSGTVVAQLSLGLPELPGISGRSGDASMAGLLSGSHTMRLWYGGPDRQRIALLGATDETDVFHSGRDVWQWDSRTRTATHTTLPADGQKSAGLPGTNPGSLTPQQLASQLLASIDPTTAVTLGQNRVVADRSAYDLVLTPRTKATRIASAHITIDGATKLPLGVQVYGRGSGSPAVDVAFSDVRFQTPSASYFSFTPPPGATVRDGSNSPAQASGPDDRASVIGSGWSSVVEYRASKQELANVGASTLAALPRAQGSWGQGRVLSSSLVSVLVTDDGRVFAGAVDPATLFATAASHK
jgi:outer membrane lipoprotein-sorting protein